MPCSRLPADRAGPGGLLSSRDVTQKVGRLVIRGFLFAFLDLPCDGSTQSWEAFVVGDNGVFAGGKAATVALAFGCTDVCSEAFAEATVQLRKGGLF